MKLVIVMHLEDDRDGVDRLLAEHQVVAYSELPVQGHGAGSAGWYGKVAPYRSRLLMAFLPQEKVDDLIGAVESCSACQDARHPIRAWVVDVERAVVSGPPAHTPTP